MTEKLDLTDLQTEVMETWDRDGVNYTEHDMVSDDPVYYLTSLTPTAEAILGNIDEMIDQLGFDSLASYISAKKESL